MANEYPRLLAAAKVAEDARDATLKSAAAVADKIARVNAKFTDAVVAGAAQVPAAVEAAQTAARESRVRADEIRDKAAVVDQQHTDTLAARQDAIDAKNSAQAIVAEFNPALDGVNAARDIATAARDAAVAAQGAASTKATEAAATVTQITASANAAIAARDQALAARDTVVGSDPGAVLTRLIAEETNRKGLIRTCRPVGMFEGHKYGFARSLSSRLSGIEAGLSAEVATRKGIIDAWARAGVGVRHKYGMQGPLAAPAKITSAGDAFGAYSAVEMRSADELAKQTSAQNRYPVDARITRIAPGLNGCLDFGQSLAGKTNTDCALSVTSTFGSIKRIGGSSRSIRGTLGAEDYETFQALGNGQLQVHTATNDDGSGALYSNRDMALIYRTQYLPYMQGEGNEAALKILKEAFHRSISYVGDDLGHQLVYGNTAQGGRPIDQLSKTSSRRIYFRNTDFVRQLREQAAILGVPAQVLLFWINQGQSDYAVGGVSEQQFYDLTRQLREDLQADIGPTDGSQIPFFIEVVASVYTVDAEFMKVANAQRRLARDNPFFFLVSPAMAETDVGGHRDNNGARWAAGKIGQATKSVIVDRVNWHPLDVVDRLVTYRGRTVRFGVNLPVNSPIRFNQPYQTTAQVDRSLYPKSGLRLTDNNGDVDFQPLQILGDATFGMEAKRDIVGPLRWWSADMTYNGGFSFISDSDTFRHPDNYEFLAPIPVTYTNESGTVVTENLRLSRPDQNLPELLGKPYPMYNQLLPGTGWANPN